MLQNKIYQNFLIEIFKTFLMVIFSLSLIALTVRAVSFLDLVVENGYPVTIYFSYSILHFFGMIPKFIPLSFLIALSIFTIKHIQDSEFIILWSSGVKKIHLVNLLFFTSIIIMVFHLIFSTFLTPYALNKSRSLLTNDNFNSFLPTVRKQQFSDTFKGFTFFVEKKINNQLQNIFLHDTGNNFKNLSSNSSSNVTTTILADRGIIENKVMMLFNGNIISSKNESDHEIIEFEKLKINLQSLSTSTIKKPKIQETSTLKLLNCFFPFYKNSLDCDEKFKKEVIPALNKRIIVPFYIPILSLICALLLIKSKRFYLNRFNIFLYGFLILLFTELAVKYTGINKLILSFFIFSPIFVFLLVYIFLILKFKKELN
tara:strand:- start:23652 stop:24767 length:1116 start_codon:yes stop_codon:yes gene_type:complete